MKHCSNVFEKNYKVVSLSLLHQSITSKQRFYLLLTSKYWFLGKCRRRILNQSCDQACTYYPLEAPFWQIMTISQEFNVTLMKITKASTIFWSIYEAKLSILLFFRCYFVNTFQPWIKVHFENTFKIEKKKSFSSQSTLWNILEVVVKVFFTVVWQMRVKLPSLCSWTTCWLGTRNTSREESAYQVQNELFSTLENYLQKVEDSFPK